jgi:putative transposase
LLARKAVKQTYTPSEEVLHLIRVFREMTNTSLRIDLANDASTLKRLSQLSYHDLSGFRVPSYYKVCAISMAAGMLASRKKSIRRGHQTNPPSLKKLILTSCYAFKMIDGNLRIPTGGGQFEEIPLNAHTLEILSDPALKANSFTLTETSLSVSYSKDVVERTDSIGAFGVDRNLRNLTVGNQNKLTFFGMVKVVDVGETTRSVVRSFKRDDVRIRKRLASKYGMRRRSRIQCILHRTSKAVITDAARERQAIVFEDICGIRKLYERGNRQTKGFRGIMNSWPYAEIKRQIEYKAAWAGIPVVHLTKGETRGTSSDCYRCGERLQGAARDDFQHDRQLWCPKCGMWPTATWWPS